MADLTLSCTTCALRGRGRDEIEETFRYAPKAGYTQWGLGGPFTWEPGLIQWLDAGKILKRMEEVGLDALTEVWTPPIPTGNREAAEQGAKHVAMSAQAAVDLGCGRIVQTGGERREGGLDQTVEGLLRLLERIQELPVRVCLEPHMGSQILTREDFDALMAKLDTEQVGITVDTGHFHAGGVDWMSLIREYPDRIYNVHLKDHVGEQSVPIGRGEIDLEGLVTVLREVGYRGPLAVELEVEDPENLPLYIEEGHRYMSALIGEE